MYGYQNRILRVNLTHGETWDDPLPERWARLFIGGSGLAARYLYELLFCNPPPQDVTDMLASVTGWEVGLEDLLTIGERIWNLKRALNSRLGLDRGNDRLPKTLLKPLPDGGAAGNQLDLDLMLREYYTVRGWDWDTGRPTRVKLVSLGLDNIADDLYET